MTTHYLDKVDMDRYGRTVGMVTLDDMRVVNMELIKEGFAWVYGTYCKREVCSEWKKLEDKARDGELGLWKDKNPVAPWEWRRMKREVGSGHLEYGFWQRIWTLAPPRFPSIATC